MIESENIVKAVYWLNSFRKRIIIMAVLLSSSALAVYFQVDYLITIMSKPLGGTPLFFLTPLEGLLVKMKIALLGGFLLAFPLLLYIIISFPGVGLSPKQKKSFYFLVIPFATFSFLAGMFFSYQLILPNTIQFFFNCAKDFMQPLISGSSYFSFAAFCLLSIGVIFQMPLVLVALSRLGLLTSKSLMKQRKTAILGSIIVLAVLTPTPDAFTLILISLPTIFLFEFSIWTIYVLEQIEQRKEVQ